MSLQVDHLLDLKKLHLKTLKKQNADNNNNNNNNAKAAFKGWRAKSWRRPSAPPLSRTTSAKDIHLPDSSPGVADDDDDDDEPTMTAKEMYGFERADRMPSEVRYAAPPLSLPPLLFHFFPVMHYAAVRSITCITACSDRALQAYICTTPYHP